MGFFSKLYILSINNYLFAQSHMAPNIPLQYKYFVLWFQVYICNVNDTIG